MPQRDYFASPNELHTFTGLESSTYREDHDANNDKIESAINDLDGRAASLEDETTQLLASLAGAVNVVDPASRLTVNDCFAVSRTADARLFGKTNSTSSLFSLSIGSVTSDFITSRWPGWMINKTMIDTDKDRHQVGVPIKWGTAEAPAAGIYKASAGIVAEPLFYQRLDARVPIENLRGNTYTLVCEYYCETDDLFDLFVKNGAESMPVTEVHSSTNDHSSAEDLLRTTLVFTVDDDADYVSYGLDFSHAGVGGVQLVCCYVLSGDVVNSLPAIGSTPRRDMHEDIQESDRFIQRFSGTTYGESEVLTTGTTDEKEVFVTVPYKQTLVKRTNDEFQYDISLEVLDATYQFDLFSLNLDSLRVRDGLDTPITIDFTTEAPYDDPIEQDYSPHERDGDYDLHEALLIRALVEANDTDIYSNLPRLKYGGEVMLIQEPTI